MKTPKVSVVVPIYNVERYLRQCLDSIVSQTLRDIEIILVNDGSTDGSLAIIQEYARKDTRIVVIDKPNEGYGKTMNRGIDRAAGEYIGIVESDDWIEPNMYETLHALAEKHDVPVVKSNFYRYTGTNGNSEKEHILPEKNAGQVIHPKEQSYIFYVMPSIWSAIYKRDFLNKNRIRFLESPGASYQDTGFNFKVWAMADKAWLTTDAFVHYRTDDEKSSVNSKDKVFCVVDEWAEIEKFMDDYPELKAACYRLRNHMKLGTYKWNLNRLDAENREEFRKVFAAEYDEALKRRGIKTECFTTKEWLKFQKILHPKSMRIKIVYILQKISRFVVNSKMKDGRKLTFMFFGLIKVKDVDAGLPSFFECEAK